MFGYDLWHHNCVIRHNRHCELSLLLAMTVLFAKGCRTCTVCCSEKKPTVSKNVTEDSAWGSFYRLSRFYATLLLF